MFHRKRRRLERLRRTVDEWQRILRAVDGACMSVEDAEKGRYGLARVAAQRRCVEQLRKALDATDN